MPRTFFNALPKKDFPFAAFNGAVRYFSSAPKETKLGTDKTHMIIQASHMNLGFMQQLQQRKNQGENLGSAESLLNNAPGAKLANGLNIDEKAGLSPAPGLLPPASTGTVSKTEKTPAQIQQGELSLGATFANEIIRRMGETTGEDGQPKDSTDLRHSLGQTLDWMRERFGDETAAAAAGMILQSTASGVNEETLGNGLLNTVKFIDRNFGFTAGDAVMAEYNSGINTELNQYFDNGQNEIFFAVESAADASAASAVQDLNTRFFMRSVQTDQANEKDTKNLTEKLLEELKAELDKTAELQDLATKLEDKFSPILATPENAIAAYQAAPMTTEPQFTDMSI